MLEILYLGLGVMLILVLNTMYMGWRGSQARKAEADRNNPFSRR